MKIRPLLLTVALTTAPLSVATATPAGAAVPTARSAVTQTAGLQGDHGRLARAAGQQLAAGKLDGARVVASNATLPRTGHGRPYRQAAFFVVLSALVGTACGVGRNLLSRRQS